MADGQNQQNQSGNNQQKSGVSGLGDSDASRASGQQGGATLGQEHQQDSTHGAQQGGGQQGGQASQGQQNQFSSQGGQQQGGGASDSRFSDQVREHMEVVDDSGQHVGTVDHVDGDRIKLSRKDSSDGQHHYVQVSQIAGIEGDKIRLRERGDNDFGQSAS